MKSDDKNQPNAQASADEAELAKVLAGMNGGQDAAAPAAAPADGGLQFEESPLPAVPAADAPAPEAPVVDVAPVVPVEPTTEVATTEPVVPDLSLPVVPGAAEPSGPLETLKQEALADLRPLVDKLTLPADEKFDTLLLIIRSTDDQSLLDSAYQAAKVIEDETKRAQALLDVIKEIDYFTNQPKST